MSDPLPGHSALGTPLESIPDAAAQATLTTRTAIRTALRDGPFAIDVRVRNSGSRTWPALLRAGADDGLVVLETRWQTPAGEAIGETRRNRLPLDVLPGDQLSVHVTQQAPAAPGLYHLAIRLLQVGGSPFASTAPLIVPVEITAPPPAAEGS